MEQKTEPVNAVYTVYTENTATEKTNSIYETAITESVPDATLLAIYQIANARLNSYKNRTTEKAVQAKTVAVEKMQTIQELLQQQGKTIAKDARNAFVIIAI